MSTEETMTETPTPTTTTTPPTTTTSATERSYQEKLDTFKPQPWQLESVEPQTAGPEDDTTTTFVDTVGAVIEMVVELRKVKEIGVSMQYDSKSRFHPTCCVLMVSTRSHDYVVDTATLGE